MFLLAYGPNYQNIIIGMLPEINEKQSDALHVVLRNATRYAYETHLLLILKKVHTKYVGISKCLNLTSIKELWPLKIICNSD